MKSNLGLETTKHMKNCINFIRRREICRVWDVSLSDYPSQSLSVSQQNVLPPYDYSIFRTAQGINQSARFFKR